MQSLKEEQQNEEKSNALKILHAEIVDTEHNQEKLLKASENLDIEFVDCIKQAELEKDVTKVFEMIAKANSLKRKSEQLKGEAKKLDDALELLRSKRRK